MNTNRNETERYGISTEQLDTLFARATEQAIADRDARQRAAEWPGNVEEALAALANGLVALRQRLDALEAKAGVG